MHVDRRAVHWGRCVFAGLIGCSVACLLVVGIPVVVYMLVRSECTCPGEFEYVCGAPSGGGGSQTTWCCAGTGDIFSCRWNCGDNACFENGRRIACER